MAADGALERDWTAGGPLGRTAVQASAAAIEAFLRVRGAHDVPHPAGNLFDHLRRVAVRLAEWGARPTLWAAAYCHAAYGTDGFDFPLLDLEQRRTLRDLIGPEAERQVYVYCSCDRAVVYPSIGESAPFRFRDRFTGDTYALGSADARCFLELTVANELDVLAHDHSMTVDETSELRALFRRARPLLTREAALAVSLELGA